MRWQALVWVVPWFRLSSAQLAEPYRYPAFFLPVCFVVLYFQETPVHLPAAVQISFLQTVQAFVQILSVLRIVLIYHPPFLAGSVGRQRPLGFVAGFTLGDIKLQKRPVMFCLITAITSA